MSDLISRSGTIRELVKLHAETGVKTAQAIRIVREMPEAEGWIPVSERLPETQGEYLVEYWAADMRFHCVLFYWINDSVWGTGWHDMGNPMEAFTDHTIDMVAWMPLPEPYREEAQDA